MTVAPTSIHPGHEWHPLRWTLVVLAAFLLGAVAVALLYHYDVLGGRPAPRACRAPASPPPRRATSRGSTVSSWRERTTS